MTIQNLFQSQILQPSDIIDELTKIYGKPTKTADASNEGLLTMFKHKKYTPMVAHWDFSKGKEKNLHLIGKGVLYDSGGYNIKNDASSMHSDKFGALLSIKIAHKLRLPVSVFFVTNLIHDDSLLPGTIIKSTKGKKVQVIDTDAEGRIGLAQLIEITDAPKLVTFATLTGHSHFAVGDDHAEVFSKDNNLLAKVVKQNNKVIGIGRYWKDYDSCLYKNKVLQNLNSKYRHAGAAKAYAFMNEFLNKNQSLTHFDIAGIMDNLWKDSNFGINEIIKTIKLIGK